MSLETTMAVMPRDRKGFSDADRTAYRTEMRCEHVELCHRIEALEAAVAQAERDGKKTACPIKVLKRQARAMRAYRDELELRATYEGVELAR